MAKEPYVTQAVELKVSYDIPTCYTLKRQILSMEHVFLVLITPLYTTHI